MNLRITSNAKNKQISFLIALDNFITRRNNNKASILMQRLNQFLEKKHPEFSLNVKEGTNNSIEMYTGKNLIAYYA
ncbi:hypothetical protein KEM09_15025 [Carboxylicivirga mesophila]|uniref:Uncharacterized protein n=1 Tax=Carboxylicivirga mesophila TaxID=1166478 RepID=A0ABS5KCF9_9BACT|nr:hypothetical protein [Carboxylicivirga mesophila]MBS2212730.1 hypothetical protein [Carboxylicivirga mesophila]